MWLRDPHVRWLLQHAATHRTLALVTTGEVALGHAEEADRYEDVASRLVAVPGLIRDAKLPAFDTYAIAEAAARIAREAEGLPPVVDATSALLARPEDPPEAIERPSGWRRYVPLGRKRIDSMLDRWRGRRDG